MWKTCTFVSLLATLASCRVDVVDGDGDMDADAEPDSALECCGICAEDELPCGDECKSLTDPDHELCRTLEGCACEFGDDCLDGGTLCDDGCVDIWNDRNNCGGCGVVCGEGWACWVGDCGICDGEHGYTLCGIECCSPDETCEGNDHCV